MFYIIENRKLKIKISMKSKVLLNGANYHEGTSTNHVTQTQN